MRRRAGVCVFGLALTLLLSAARAGTKDEPGVRIPAPGYRYWQAPFERLDLEGACNSVVVRKDGGSVSFETPLDALHAGDNPIYVCVRQEGGEMAWSSPVFVGRA